MTSDAYQRLSRLKDELSSLEPWPWNNIAAWSAKATPIIRADWPDHFDQFRKEIAEPRWTVVVSALPRWTMPGSVLSVGKQGGADVGRAKAQQDSENVLKAEQAKKRILGFLDGLLTLSQQPSTTQVQSPHTTRAKILQTILDMQGNSAHFTHAGTIAEPLGLSVDEIEGHLDLLRGEGKIQLDVNSSGYFGHLLPGQKQRFLESQMVISKGNDPNAVRAQILRTILDIQGDSPRYTHARTIADRLGMNVEEIEGHLEILREDRRVQAIRDSGGYSACLTPGQKQKVRESEAASPSSTPRTSNVEADVSPTSAIILRVMIASPGDTAEERQAIKDALIRWNGIYGDVFGVRLEPVMWELHATPGLEGRPQGMINKELVSTSAFLIAVFRAPWKPNWH